MQQDTIAAPPGQTPSDAMLQLIFNFWITRSLYAAAKLGIADVLKSGPAPIDRIAAETGTQARSLYRLLRALASVDVFSEEGSGRFRNTPLSETLISDRPGTLRYFAISELGEEHYGAWGDLLHSIRTGEIAFDKHFGAGVWEYLSRNPGRAATFNESMSRMTEAVNDAIIWTYSFAGIRQIVDIGGGLGSLMMSILKWNETMKGILFDQPAVVAEGRKAIEKAGLSDRCSVVGGDFFESVPRGGDAYTMKWIIHDWDDDRAMQILNNCREARADDGKVVIIDTIIPGPNEPSPSKLIDLNMLVMTGGLERTLAEFESLFERCGLRLTKVVTTPSPFSVLEGVKS